MKNQKRVNPVTRLLMATAATGLIGAAAHADPCIKTRAAFDIGSSATKLSVFEINICKGRIVKQLYPGKGEKDAARAKIDFKKDLTEGVAMAKENGTYDPSMFPLFSSLLMAKAKKSFQDLKNNAARFNPDDYVAVATQAFRESKNSEDLINWLEDNKIKALIPDQPLEAMIELMGATADLRDKTDVRDKDIVSWGIGAASMQMGMTLNNGKFGAFTSQLASEPFQTRAVEQLRGSGALLPLSREEIDTLVRIAREEASSAPIEVQNRMGDRVMVVGVGGVINQSLKPFLAMQGVKRNFFIQEDVQDALYKLADQGVDSEVFGVESTDPDAPPFVARKYREATVTNLALILGVMKTLGISQVKYSDIDNTFGAPFTTEFGIKMAKPKPKTPAQPVLVKQTVKRKVRAADGQETVKEAEITVEKTQPKTAEVQVAVGGNDENQSTCDISPHTMSADRKTCYITAPPVRFANWCTGGIQTINGARKCIVLGNPKLVYHYEGN